MAESPRTPVRTRAIPRAPRQLVGRAALRALKRRRDVPGLLHLAGHTGLLVLTAAALAATRGGPWLLPALALHGVILVFLFAPLHEAIHETAFRSRALNRLTATLCGLVLVLPPLWFRAYHFDHHLYTQDPSRDPELKAAKPASVAAYLGHVSGLPYWADRLVTVARYAAGRPPGEPFAQPPRRSQLIAEARRFVIVYLLFAVAAVAGGWWDEALLLGGALVLGQPALRLFLLAEHTGCAIGRDMLTNSRTTRTNRLVRWLAWNMPYHVEHHAYPWVPYHALPAVHAALRGHGQVPARGYLAVNGDILRAIRRG